MYSLNLTFGFLVVEKVCRSETYAVRFIVPIHTIFIQFESSYLSIRYGYHTIFLDELFHFEVVIRIYADSLNGMPFYEHVSKDNFCIFHFSLSLSLSKTTVGRGFEPLRPCGRLISSQVHYRYASPPLMNCRIRLSLFCILESSSTNISAAQISSSVNGRPTATFSFSMSTYLSILHAKSDSSLTAPENLESSSAFFRIMSMSSSISHKCGGGRGIRTPKTFRSLVFKTSALPVRRALRQHIFVDFSNAQSTQ